MKIYITSRFDSSLDNKKEIDNLCTAVRNAGVEDFHATRDMVGPFDSQRDLWETARKYINECDALLIDVSDSPSGGRLVETGMAFSLNKPIYVIVKNGVKYKSFYEGIATSIIKYDEINDITEQLKAFKLSAT